MDDPRDPRSRRSGDRQAIAIVPQHEDGVGERVAAGLEHLLEHPRNLGAPAAKAAANCRELRRCIVADRAVRTEDPRGRVDQCLQVGQPARAFRERSRLGLAESPADRLRRFRRGEDRTEVFGRCRAARVLERGERSRDVLESGERQASFAGAEQGELGGFLQAPADVRFTPGRFCFEDGLATGAGSGESGNQSEDDVELECVEIDGVLRRKGDYIVARRSSESLRSIFLRAWIALRLRFALGFS